MASDVSEDARRLVIERAGHRCEYCLLHEQDAYFPHQVDHVISRKHGGSSDPENLAYACFRCNVFKGTDVGSFHAESGKVVALFHPRRDRWSDHFELRGFVIEPLTVEGEVTARLLKMNVDRRVAERRLLLSIGRYPG